MTNKSFTAGDLIRIDSDTMSGSELEKQLPGLVVSNDAYTRATGLWLVAPISSDLTEYPTHIPLDERTGTHGSIFTELTKPMDLLNPECNTQKIERCPDEILSGARTIIKTFY